MKVATLWLLRVVQVHLRTLKTSGSTSIFMFCLTFTWHESRQCSRISPRLSQPSSVGSTEPPPSSTWTLQTPHEPIPPQADGMKILCEARVLSNDEPAGTLSALLASPLMRIVTSSELTSCFFAYTKSNTSNRMITTNIAVEMPTIVAGDSSAKTIASKGWITARYLRT